VNKKREDRTQNKHNKDRDTVADWIHLLKNSIIVDY